VNEPLLLEYELDENAFEIINVIGLELDYVYDRVLVVPPITPVIDVIDPDISVGNITYI
jgi:hypothetical protein